VDRRKYIDDLEKLSLKINLDEINQDMDSIKEHLSVIDNYKNNFDKCLGEMAESQSETDRLKSHSDLTILRDELIKTANCIEGIILKDLTYKLIAKKLIKAKFYSKW